jgi:hypothetical protein
VAVAVAALAEDDAPPAMDVGAAVEDAEAAGLVGAAGVDGVGERGGILLRDRARGEGGADAEERGRHG